MRYRANKYIDQLNKEGRYLEIHAKLHGAENFEIEPIPKVGEEITVPVENLVDKDKQLEGRLAAAGFPIIIERKEDGG